MSDIKFGTDGWRARMDESFTFENVEKLAQAFSDYVNQNSSGETPKVAVGYDFRHNSDQFALTFTQVLLANNIDTVLSDRPVPTPAVSRYVLGYKYDFGIAVTASHNPWSYNGIKIKDKDGSSANAEITRGVESLLDKTPINKVTIEEAESKITNIFDLYLQTLKSYLNFDLFTNKPFSILVDSMNGVGAFHLQEILEGTNIKVTTIRGERTSEDSKGAPEPITKFTSEAVEMMKNENYDACFMTDGDADRIGAIRPGGDFVSPGKLLTLIMLHFAEDLNRKGEVVTTLSNTSLIYKVAKSLGLKTHVTPVGFKYIVDIMRKSNILIAGEESGGLAFQDYMFERDGLLSALLIIQMMQCRNKSFVELLDDLDEKYGRFLYARKDLHYPDDAKPKLMSHLREINLESIVSAKVVEKDVRDGVKFYLADDAWLLFRMSGTEPLLRVYAESPVPNQAAELVEWGESTSQQFLK